MRQQQKADTRARIAAAAMTLFAERGFDDVRTVDVAAAAGVTEKTVFNHFATKEDLVYPSDAGFASALIDAIRLRDSEASVLDAARTFFLGMYARFPNEPAKRERATVLARLVEGSPALRARERAIHGRNATGLSAAIRSDLDLDEDDLRPTVVADAIIAVHRAVIVGYRRGLLTGEPPASLGTRMQAAATAAFDLLAEGIAHLGQGGSAGPGSSSRPSPS